jgi:phosphate transport system permease protein
MTTIDLTQPGVVTPDVEAPTVSTPPPPRRRPVPRKVRVLTFDDWMSLAGSLLSSLALVEIVYEHLLDGSGTLGFLVVWYATFVAIYALVVGLSNPWPIVADRIVTTALWAAGGIVVFALGSAIVYVLYKGFHAYSHWSFFTHNMAGVSPTAPLSEGGVYHAIVGSVIQVGMGIAMAIPLGIATAVYMAEVGGRLSRLVRTVVEAMTALPEILAGLFVYAALILSWPHLQKSGFAVSVAMAVTMVPIIARASEVALRVVPSGLREASLALGASQWSTVRKVVLPSARAGLVTAAILGVARGVGETAIVLIVSGASTYTNYNPWNHEMNSLPLFILTAFKSGQPLMVVRMFGAASVLLLMVVVLFVVARVFSREKSVRR